MKKIILLFLFSCCVIIAESQIPYTDNKFNIISLIDISYGTAIDYAGNTDTLKLDIYKPSGDSNCLRPILIMVHGGAWIGGSKQDYNMAYMSQELAKKGWVVANINYRLGTHKASNYTMYAFCNNSISQPCGYICDSAEVFRANYRAMQDAKGAIRYMKSRNAIDSTDINNVFIAGESAGGFISLATAFTDKLTEKPILCDSMADAPNPDADLKTYACIPAQNKLSRPDLGSIDGILHTGIYDARVNGAGSFYGGVLDLNIFQQTVDLPCVYMFHQGSDVVVNYRYGTLLGRLSWECFAQTNLCQSYHYYPNAYGNESIRQYFASQGGSAPVYQADIINNYSYLNNCFSNGHSVDNLTLRLQNMVKLFANKIAISGNNPLTNCISNSIIEPKANNDVIIYPNPANLEINISYPFATNVAIEIINIIGETVIKAQNQHKVDISQLQSGIYFIKAKSGNNLFVNKFLKL